MNNERKTRKFHEFATEEDKELWKIAQEWDISDEELFENESEVEELKDETVIDLNELTKDDENAR